QRGVGENPVKAALGQLHREEILMQDLAARVRLRHGDKLARSVEAYGFVPQRSKVNEVAAGTAPEIQDRIGPLTLYRIEQGRVILADIVVSRTVPEGSCEPIVIRNCRLAEAPVSLRHRLRAADARKTRGPGRRLCECDGRDRRHHRRERLHRCCIGAFFRRWFRPPVCRTARQAVDAARLDASPDRSLLASPLPSCFASAEWRSGGRYCRTRRSTHCRSAYRARQIATRHRMQKQSERFSSGFSEIARNWAVVYLSS